MRLNVLDYLGGIQFEAEPERTEKEWEKRIEEREAADETVIVRLWLRGEEEPIVHHDIEHGEWGLAQACIDGNEKFIRFRDEDGEDVLYGTDHIDAIEMLDPFYLTEEQVEKILARYDDADEEPTASPDIEETSVRPNPAPQP
jgi:hypothetical protein